jgi:hypothetical protein|tara:strand:- start:173 stop:442 length:270 start_codon:yes stop_codon:yes gene_type:complete
MARRSSVPGMLADQGDVISISNANHLVYITDVIYTGGLPADYIANGGLTNIGPIETQLTSVYNWHFSSPVPAPEGFTVPSHHRVIYYND